MQNDRLAWPILLLLLTVLVPSMGVVWMMRQAVQNERLATSQRLREAYQTQLEVASQSIRQRWQEKLQQSATQVDEATPEQTFEKLARTPFFDSVVLFNASGDVVYPEGLQRSKEEPVAEGPQWAIAEKLEFVEQNLLAAEMVYAEIVDQDPSPIIRARARQAQIRCLLKLDDRDAAVEKLRVQASEATRNQDGRSFAAAAQLQLIRLLPQESDEQKQVETNLVARLNDYEKSSLPSSQRRFLMEALVAEQAESSGDAQVVFPTLDSELLAAQWKGTEWKAVTTPSPSPKNLIPAPLDNVWSQASQDGRLVGLFRTETVRRELLELTKTLPLPTGVGFTVTAPSEVSDSLLATSLGEAFGRWRLELAATAGDPFAETSQQRRAVHAWIAGLVVAVAFVLAWLLAITLRRRLRLAQLKNDLVATVSHELKTPLASIRLLVDTLLADESASGNGLTDQTANPTKVREYLELISHENARLTRLIDSFLTFSRLERGRQRFEFQQLEVASVVEKAASVACEHLPELGECLQVSADASLTISGDEDTLVTAIVNLLENAWKYSDSPRAIVLTAHTKEAAHSKDEQVLIEIQDNGIGLSPRAANRVFDRFYQVDQRVARSHDGCGLGLSIVRGIVEAHQGSVSVKSQPRQGSTFSIRLPRAATLGESR